MSVSIKRRQPSTRGHQNNSPSKAVRTKWSSNSSIAPNWLDSRAGSRMRITECSARAGPNADVQVRYTSCSNLKSRQLEVTSGQRFGGAISSYAPSRVLPFQLSRDRLSAVQASTVSALGRDQVKVRERLLTATGALGEIASDEELREQSRREAAAALQDATGGGAASIDHVHPS